MVTSAKDVKLMLEVMEGVGLDLDSVYFVMNEGRDGKDAWGNIDISAENDDGEIFLNVKRDYE